MGDARAQSSPRCVIVEVVKGVPRWYRVTADVLAVGFSLWVGLHVLEADPIPWIAIYAVAAIVSALLPSHRTIGFVGLALGIAVGAWGGYLLRDAWAALRLDDLLVAPSPLGGGREAIVLALAGLWLVAGSAFRTQRA
jgi:hypothetical protein